MQRHLLIKAGLGLGLLAGSMAASAQLQSFAKTMIFAKFNAGVSSYAVFTPFGVDGNQGVVLLDLSQGAAGSGTAAAPDGWGFAVGGTVNAGAGGPVWAINLPGLTDTASAITVSYVDTASSFTNSTKTAAAGTITSFYGGGTSSVILSFLQAATSSGQACNMTFSAVVGTDLFLKFSNFSVRPDTNYPSAQAAVSYRTGSATTATASLASTDWNAFNFSASSAFPTFGAYTLQTGTAASNSATYAASVLSRANICNTGVYTVRNNLNAAGSQIGAREGMFRLF
jgi:hypothetical protein